LWFANNPASRIANTVVFASNPASRIANSVAFTNNPAFQIAHIVVFKRIRYPCQTNYWFCSAQTHASIVFGAKAAGSLLYRLKGASPLQKDIVTTWIL
jgi:hypothetical protein